MDHESCDMALQTAKDKLGHYYSFAIAKEIRDWSLIVTTSELNCSAGLTDNQFLKQSEVQKYMLGLRQINYYISYRLTFILLMADYIKRCLENDCMLHNTCNSN